MSQSDDREVSFTRYCVALIRADRVELLSIFFETQQAADSYADRCRAWYLGGVKPTVVPMHGTLPRPETAGQGASR